MNRSGICTSIMRLSWIGMMGLLSTSTAQAALSLTAAGVSDGFSLSTYYSDPAAYYGVLGLATASDGSILATSYGRGQLYKLNDVDGQSFATVVQSVQLPGAFTIAKAGVGIYATAGATYYSVSNNLAVTPITLTPAVSTYLGLWGNPVTGHLLSSSSAGLIDIAPSVGTWKQVGPAGADGVSVSKDGKTAYGEFGGGILGYDIASGTQVFNSGALGHGPDGTGVIYGGKFDGHIIVNNNDGSVGLLDPTGIDPYTIIATGGARGDFVSPDANNGSLFLSMADSVMRLSCGVGCGFTPPPPAVPEPSEWSTILIGLGGILGLMRRRSSGKPRGASLNGLCSLSSAN